jgi:hypothetical protein
MFRGFHSLPDKIFELRYQSPLFNNVLFVGLTQGSSFLTKSTDFLSFSVIMGYVNEVYRGICRIK